MSGVLSAIPSLSPGADPLGVVLRRREDETFGVRELSWLMRRRTLSRAEAATSKMIYENRTACQLRSLCRRGLSDNHWSQPRTSCLPLALRSYKDIFIYACEMRHGR